MDNAEKKQELHKLMTDITAIPIKSTQQFTKQLQLNINETKKLLTNKNYLSIEILIKDFIEECEKIHKLLAELDKEQNDTYFSNDTIYETIIKQLLRCKKNKQEIQNWISKIDSL